MNTEQHESPGASADADSIEDILERGLGQMVALSKANTTHLAAAAAAAGETRDTVATLSEMITARLPGEAQEPPAADGAAGSRTAVQEEEPAATQGETGSPASGPGDQGAADQGSAGGPQDASEPGADDAEEEEDPVTTAETKDEVETAPTEAESQDETTPEGGGDGGPAAEDATPEDASTEAAASAEPAPAAGDETPPAPPAHPAPRKSKRDRKLRRLATKIDKHLEAARQPSPQHKELLDTLGAIRTAQEALREAITAAIALTPSSPPDDPRIPPAWQVLEEVMGRLDGLARMIRPVPKKPVEPLPIAGETAPSHESEAPVLPAPDPAPDPAEVRIAVDQLIEAAARPRRGFIRFAWISILVVTLCAGALGGFLQREFTPLDPLDDTHGWKDRVWDHAGAEITRCIIAAADRGGRCAVTVEVGGSASDP